VFRSGSTGGRDFFSRSSPLSFHFSGEVWLIVHTRTRLLAALSNPSPSATIRRGTRRGHTPDDLEAFRPERTVRMQRMAVKAARDMSGPTPSTVHRATQPDLLTIAAIAIIATVIGDVIHEGLGHGGMSAAMGGHPLAAFYCALRV
jgi:hypothetical protein